MNLNKLITSVLLVIMVSILGLQLNVAAVAASSNYVQLNGGIIENGRTLIPMRSLFEALGAKVVWDGKAKTVTATNEKVSIKLTIDSKKVLVNGNAITLDVAPKVIKSQTMVPVRFVSETLGATVKWDSLKSIVTVSLNDRIIEINVEKSQKKLTIDDINKIIETAETKLIEITSSDLPAQWDRTLTAADIIASKQKAKKYYSDRYLDDMWSKIYSSYLLEPWYTNYLYQDVRNHSIVTRTNDKVVVRYWVFDDAIEEEYVVEYTLVKINDSWLIDKINYPKSV